MPIGQETDHQSIDHLVLTDNDSVNALFNGSQNIGALLPIFW
jgi:hypothetical protein